MATQSIQFTRRQIDRARATAEKALQGPNVALKAFAPDMIAQCNQFEGADAEVRAAEIQVNKEAREGEAALDALRGLFDEARELVAAKSGTTYESASAFGTPDDFLNAAEDLEGQLEAAASTEAWAAPVLASFSDALEAASKEYQEASDARKALQKSALAREQAEGRLRPILVRFRRLVRATFGSTSREYRELLDRRSRGQDDPVAEGAGGAGPS